MNITQTSLEALILKATHESLPAPDAAAVEAFCTIMRDSAEGPQLAAQALATRIHSPKAREALLALMMLDRCMRRCDTPFHAEIGKFRFLNEMIKLVSPKYYADRTASEVKTRVLQLFHAWSIEYHKEFKFKVAYEMLKNQGVIRETPPPLPPDDTPPVHNRAKSTIFEDEEKSKLLQKLLQSKKSEDLQHANRLIKTMVREVERQNEANSRRAQEVSAALDSAGLLRDMLLAASDASSDEEQLIHELHSTCIRLRPILQQLADNDTQAEYLSDILHASDVIDEVCERYNVFLIQKKANEQMTEQASLSGESLLDFAGANTTYIRKNVAPKKDEKPTNVIDELGDIFAASSESTNNIAEPLKPVALMPTADDVDLLGDRSNKHEGWNELDSLGEELLKQSLPENAKRIENFNSKTSTKVPMNALASPKHDVNLQNNGALLDLDFFTKKPQECKPVTASTSKDVTPSDDIMVDISTDVTDATLVLNNNTECNLNNILDFGLDNAKSETVIDKETSVIEKKEVNHKNNEVKPLTDINVTLQNVRPSKLQPLTVFEEEEGVTVVLHFCQDKPRQDVNVLVISTTSKNKLPIEDYKFQSVVPKGCKVRLLTPSGTSLPAYNPFLPPPALTQVMLLAKPPSMNNISLKFVITYTCDEEVYSEIGEVKELPLEKI